MKIAWCLFGQPRRLVEGHDVIKAFLKNMNVEADFYCHAWHTFNGGTFEASPWRDISPDEKKIDPTIIDKISSLYNPILLGFHCPQTFDIRQYKNSMFYNNSNPKTKANINNSLSQAFSRQQVKDSLLASKRKYDVVITSRYDFLNEITFDLNSIQLDNPFIYTSDMFVPRKFFPDGLLICDQETFFKTTNVFTDLKYTINNQELFTRMRELGEDPNFNFEMLLFATYLHYHDSVSNARYVKGIPDFH